MMWATAEQEPEPETQEEVGAGGEEEEASELFKPVEEESEDEELARGKELMKGNTLVMRFCLYGFLKNLMFFEPYLWVVLVQWGVSLAQIGLLVSVQKMVCYVFELPSGLLADRWGMRRQLCLCFVFYILSFACYYNGRLHFGFLLLASMLYGLGEAMRSGTHKAMVMLWLQKHGLARCKSFLYGKTRSWSLAGSGVSALASIAIMIAVQSAGATENIFLWSVLPYIADLVMVASYPDYMDRGSGESTKPSVQDAPVPAWWLQPQADLRALLGVIQDGPRRRCLFSSCSFMAYHDILKHFIQAIVLLYGARGLGYEEWSGHETQQTILLGVTYGVFYFLSAPVTRSAYKVQRRFSSGKAAMDSIQSAYAGLLLVGALALWLGAVPLLPLLYIGLYATYVLLSADGHIITIIPCFLITGRRRRRRRRRRRCNMITITTLG
jgi:MFS family permease